MQWRKIFPASVISREYCHVQKMSLQQLQKNPPQTRGQLLGGGEVLVHKHCKNNVSFEGHFNVRGKNLSSHHILK